MKPNTVIRVRHTVARRCECGEPIVCVSGGHAHIKGRHSLTKGMGTATDVQTQCPRCLKVVVIEDLASLLPGP